MDDYGFSSRALFFRDLTRQAGAGECATEQMAVEFACRRRNEIVAAMIVVRTQLLSGGSLRILGFVAMMANKVFPVGSFSTHDTHNRPGNTSEPEYAEDPLLCHSCTVYTQ